MPPFHHRVLQFVPVLAVCAGCWGNREELGRVTGQVTFQGKPVANAVVMFRDAGRGIHMRAFLDEEGRFDVSMAAGYGLPLGTYRVAVVPAAKGPKGPVDITELAAATPPHRRDIPERYQDTKTSGLTLCVERGENVLNLEMTP